MTISHSGLLFWATLYIIKQLNLQQSLTIWSQKV